MKYEFYIARKLRLNGDDDNKKKSSPILNIAIAGIVLAIVIMIIAIAIVSGFKKEITTKIYNLDAHIRITPTEGKNGLDPHPMEIHDFDYLRNSNLGFIKNIDPISERTVILKTKDDFSGLVLRGYDDNADTKFINDAIIEGKLPNFKPNGNMTEIAISDRIANLLGIKIGDKVFGYFIDEKIKARNLIVSGIYKTNFEDFDKHMIICNQTMLRQLNGWDDSQSSYIAITSNNINNLKDDTSDLFQVMLKNAAQNPSNKNYEIFSILDYYASYFSWLSLLDTNIIIILVLMSLVAGFTLIAGLLIIVLERINTIGILKSLGASNNAVRRVFIILTQKLILKSIIGGNLIGIGLALVQKYFHILKLNPDSYYMPYVPIDINFWYILILNIAIITISYLALIAPSYVISTITPAKSLKFE